MKIHPNDETLLGLVRALADQHQALLWHLADCMPCRERLRGLPRPADGPSGASVDYDAVFAEVGRLLRQRSAALEAERAAAPALCAELWAAPEGEREALLAEPRFHTWGLCELLVDRSREEGLCDPARAGVLAALALRLTDRLPRSRLSRTAGYRPELVEDLRARAWGHLGNARRLTADLAGAAEAFSIAGEHLARGTRDALEQAALLDLEASLRRDERRFDEALRLLGAAVAAFLRNGERHRAGRSLVQASLVHCYAGQTEEGIADLRRALQLIDPAAEPRLLLCARHNLIDCVTEAGRYAEALALYRLALPLYRCFPDAWTQNRRKWVKGKIDLGLGRLAAGEALLHAARAGFAAEGAPYDMALVSLDLSLLYARQGRTAELKQVAAGMLPVFVSRGIHREALAALAFLQQAADAETATLDLVTRVAAHLRRAQHDPDLCWPAG